jgi:hypothetical protein
LTTKCSLSVFRQFTPMKNGLFSKRFEYSPDPF